jgi:hypothetical protein
MMTFAVSFTSGFLLAASSIETIVDDMKETYRIEDGRFACDFEPGADALAAVRQLGVTLHQDFYKQVSTTLEGGDGGQAAGASFGNVRMQERISIDLAPETPVVTDVAFAQQLV